MAEVATDSGLTRTGETTWTFDTVERSFTQTRAGHEVRGHPALVDEGATVGLQVFGTEDEAQARHRLGVRRLLLLDLEQRGGNPVKRVLDSLTNTEKLGLAGSPYPSVAELLEDCRAAVVQAVVDARPEARDRAAYDALLSAAADDQEARLREVMAEVIRVLGLWRHTEKSLSGRADLATLPALTDMRAQLARLVHPGFVAEAGATQLRRYPAYLAALDHRRERLEGQVARDRQLMEQIADLQEAYLHQVAALPEGRPPGERLRQVRWMLEEYRISLWAQHLGTPYPVSDQRLRKALASSA
jgi:ATP-dependent helicase HrpA